MFEHARLKLTAWYLAIIMTISVLFSVVIYAGVNQEFIRFERMQNRIRVRQEKVMLPLQGVASLELEELDPELANHARIRFITVLSFINIAIFGLAGAAGYFLAGRTLLPIKNMVDEQNRFVTDASHELRTPLTSLRSEIEVALRNKKITLSDSKKILESNLEEVINLQYLSDSLLELSQVRKTSLTAVSLSTCLHTSLKKLDKRISQKELVIEKNIEEVSVIGQPEAISEVITILLDNAIKYTPSQKKINISIEESKDYGKLRVEDEGIGIEKEDLPHIFDRFYRASKSRSKEEYPGYGLGLSIAKKIIQSLNGSIFVESKPNEGSTFTVVLPLAAC